jgi:RNA polymerase sigma-70 factor (ECF subfamily)
MAPAGEFELTQNGLVSDHRDPSDKELMEKVRSADTFAFTILVDRYKLKLFNLIYRMLQNKEEAEDILQETFLRVYKERESYDSAYAFSTWVYTIALNLCRNELKRRKKFRFFGLDLIKDNREYAISAAKKSEGLSLMLEKAILSLPIKYRTAFLLRDVDEFSYEEVSKSLGIPLGTVKSRVNRARLLLRDKLRPKIKEYYEVSKSSPIPIQLL